MANHTSQISSKPTPADKDGEEEETEEKNSPEDGGSEREKDKEEKQISDGGEDIQVIRPGGRSLSWVRRGGVNVEPKLASSRTHHQTHTLALPNSLRLLPHNSSLYTLVKRLLGNGPWNSAPVGHTPVSSHTQRGEGAGRVGSAQPQTPESGDSVEVMPGIFLYRTGGTGAHLSRSSAHTLPHGIMQPTAATRRQPGELSDEPEGRTASMWGIRYVR